MENMNVQRNRRTMVNKQKKRNKKNKNKKKTKKNIPYEDKVNLVNAMNDFQNSFLDLSQKFEQINVLMKKIYQFT